MAANEPNSNNRVNSDEKTSFDARQLVTKLKKEGLNALGALSEAEHKSLWIWSQGLVREYEKVVKNNPMDIRDVQELPCPKEDIQMAIKLGLLPLSPNSDAEKIVHLKTLFIELASFQTIETKDKENIVTEIKKSAQSTVVAQKKVAQLLSRYYDRIVAERKTLLEEIRLFSEEVPEQN